MEKLYCWRCEMEVPMLDEDEYEVAYKLYGMGFERRKLGLSREESFQPMLDYYNNLTDLVS